MADKNNYLGFNFGDFSDPTNRTTGVPTKYLNLKGLTDFWAQIKSYIDAQDQNLFSSITSNSNKTLTIQGNGTSLGTYNGLEAKTINITPTSIGALSLSGGSLTGPLALNGSDADRNLIRVNCNTSGDANQTGNYGYTLKFLGSGTGVNNALALYADNQTATTQNLATKWLNDGTMYGRSILPHTNNTFDLGSSSYKWKNIYATTFTGNLTGAATSASKLGTTTVGSSTMPIYLNAGSPTAITSFPEAYLSNGGKNFAGGYSPLDAALIPILGANRFAYANPAGIIVEYSTDGGSTWVDYGATNSMKYGLTTEGTAFKIGGPDTTAGNVTANNKLRITIDTDAASIYTALHKFALCVATYGSSGSKVTIERSLESTPDTFVVAAENVPINGWPGWNIINVNSFITYGNSASGQYGLIRFTFSHDSCSSSYTGLQVLKLYAYGGVGWTTPSYTALHGSPYILKNDKTARFDVGVLPKATNTYSLGSSSLKWSNVYATTLNATTFNGTNAYATTFTGNLKGAMLSIVPSSSAGSAITEIPNAIRFDSVLASNTTSGFGSGYNNAILTIGRYSTTKYASQLGFSGNGKLYYRSFSNIALDDSKTWSQVAFTSDIPASLKNPYSLTIQGNGTTLTNGVYDGSAAKTVNITPDSIGAATASHVHTVTYTPSGTVASTFSNGSVSIGASSGTVSVASSEHTHTIDTGDLSATFIGTSTTVPATTTTGTTVASQNHTHSTDEKSLSVSYSNGVLTITSAHTHTAQATTTTGTTVASQNHTHAVTAAGTISITGDDVTTGTPSGTTTVASSAHTHTGTATGTVTSTFTGTEDTVTTDSVS